MSEEQLLKALKNSVNRFLEEAVRIYSGASEEVMMADVHQVAHEILDRQLALYASRNTDVDPAEVERTRQSMGRYVHLLIEKARAELVRATRREGGV
jgi:hypothetical protein